MSRMYREDAGPLARLSRRVVRTTLGTTYDSLLLIGAIREVIVLETKVVLGACVLSSWSWGQR